LANLRWCEIFTPLGCIQRVGKQMVERYPIFMGEVPFYEIRGDNMHIMWPTLELVLPVRTMLGGMAQAKVEIDNWSRRTAEVIPFPCEERRTG
jgi:hypothetical protein